MGDLVKQVAQLHQKGVEIALVSSGAITTGRHELNLRKEYSKTKKLRGVSLKQVLASIGQSYLIQAYDQLFRKYGICVAQALLTRTDILNRLSYLNIRNTLLTLLELRIIPIINENDVVAVEEIEGTTFGDNDTLSAMVANLIDADLLIMLSDVKGLYTADPNRESHAELISQVSKIDESIEQVAKESFGSKGTGGMVTKIAAAKLATASGIGTVIADGRETNILLRLVSSESIGTFFSPTTSRLESRKRWLISQLPTRGRIFIDEGAEIAIKNQNKSLLPVGITKVEGSFERGDVVAIFNSEGRYFAQGISNYSSKDIEIVKGIHSSRISEFLGYEYGAEVVHQNNLVLL
jgi:glutamate 5-kinase